MLQFLVDQMCQKTTKRELIKHGITMAFTLPLLNSCSFVTDRLEIVQHNITLNKPSFANKEITAVQLSDLHLRSLDAFHEKIIHEVNKINPELLFITGDTINKSHELPLIYDFVSKLKVSSGKYAVLGNWDYWSLAGIRNIRREYEKADCKLLVNEKVGVSIKGLNLSITGVDDYSVGTPDMTWYKNDPLQASYKIFLSHCPGYRDQIATDAFDLMLSGHTHGGQVNILGYSLYIPKGSGSYVKGWYNDIKPRLYVNRGIGTTLLPIRIGARPEITVFKING